MIWLPIFDVRIPLRQDRLTASVLSQDSSPESPPEPCSGILFITASGRLLLSRFREPEKVLSGEVVLSGPEAESFSLIGVLPGQPVFPTTPVVTKTSIDSDATTTMTTTIPAATSTILSGKNSSTGGTSSGIDTDATTTIVPDASGAANTQKKGGGRGGIVGGVLGGVALFLVVFGAVMYRLVRGHSGESQQPYGQTTENPTYTTPENAAAPLAPQEDSTA